MVVSRAFMVSRVKILSNLPQFNLSLVCRRLKNFLVIIVEFKTSHTAVPIENTDELFLNLIVFFWQF